MKKILLVAALVLGLSASANAQLYLGGGFGGSVSSNGDFNFTLAPQVGYNFNKFILLGGQVSYTFGSNIFGVTPFLRVSPINIPKVLSIRILAEAPCYFRQEYKDIGVQFRPGLSVPVGNVVRLSLYIGTFGYRWLYDAKGLYYEGWNATVNWSTVTLGVSVEL